VHKNPITLLFFSCNEITPSTDILGESFSFLFCIRLPPAQTYAPLRGVWPSMSVQGEALCKKRKVMQHRIRRCCPLGKALSLISHCRKEKAPNPPLESLGRGAENKRRRGSPKGYLIAENKRRRGSPKGYLIAENKRRRGSPKGYLIAENKSHRGPYPSPLGGGVCRGDAGPYPGGA
jgi:hypothetical protein